MKCFHYPVLLTQAEEGGYVVTCRDLPSLITQGEDERDALAQAIDAMDEVFAAHMIEGIDFPEPSKARCHERLVAPPLEAVARAALWRRTHIKPSAPKSQSPEQPRPMRGHSTVDR